MSKLQIGTSGVYFNNDPDGNAIRDAQRLYSLLGCC